MKHLKILFILQSPWGTNLGVSKVHYDLKEAYEKLGHKVDYLDLKKLYPKGQSMYDKVYGQLYTEKIFNYLSKHAYKYDVIDANYSCIVYPKSAYNFKGIVVYRSHGLQPLYRQIEQSAVYKKMEVFTYNKVAFKTKLGNLLRFIQKKDGDYELFNSIRHADIVHALNQAEYEYFIEYGVPKNKIFLIPNGIPDELSEKSQSISLNSKHSEISFVGSWTLRKGIKDLDSIIKEAQKQAKIEKVNLLGGGTNSNVYSSFDNQNHSLLKIVPRYSQNELPTLLEHTKVGVFPSYAEGFCLAILEQIALGIPVVAYNTPGPIDILQSIDKTLVIRPGDKEAFGRKVAEILNLDDENYMALSLKCRERAEAFKINKISQQFIDAYFSTMKCLNQES
jgi:glycosyltransferase involved in cell wall biosynthesis